MKKQIRISKFFASKVPKRSANGENVIVIDIDEDSSQNEVYSGEKKETAVCSLTSNEKRLCTSLESGTPAKRPKCNPSSTDIKNTEKLELSSLKLSHLTKQKLSSFSADSDFNLTDRKPSEISIEDLKRRANLCKASSSVDDNVDLQGRENSQSQESSDENEAVAGSSSGECFLSTSQPLTSSQSKVLSTFTSVKHRPLTKDTAVVAVPSSNKRTKCKYTPLELQFVAIKEKNPDAVLFVECGYKYRFFGDDAEIAAEVLKIFCHLDHNFMTASIPTHRLFVHVRRLVAAGYKVGVVKQTETAALKAAGENKTAPFTRELTTLYTKSTLIGEDVDPLSEMNGSDNGEGSTSPGPNSHLLCLFEIPPPSALCSQSKPQTIAVMSVQPSTGELVYDCFEDGLTRSELETRMVHIQPAELLLPCTLTEKTNSLINDIVAHSSLADDRIRIERLDDTVFDHGKSLDTVTKFYTTDDKGSDLLQEIIILPKQVICCLSALIVYLKQFHLDRVLRSLNSITRFTAKNKSMELNGNTMRNLEIFKNLTNGGEKGTLFSVMNHTVTKFGGRLLRKWLSQPLLNMRLSKAYVKLSPNYLNKADLNVQCEIIERQDAVEELIQTDCSGLSKLPTVLKRLPDLEKGLCTIFHKKCSVSEFYLLVRVLHRVEQELSTLTEAVQSNVKSQMLQELLLQIPDLLRDISTFSEALYGKTASENKKTDLFVDESQFPGIIRKKAEIETVLSKLKDHRRDVRLTLKHPSLDYKTVLGTEFLVEVRNTNLKLVPNDWVKISSTKAVTRFHTPYIEKKYKELSQLREKLSIECNRAWMEFLEKFGENFQRYRRAVHHLAVLDGLLSLVYVAKQPGYCRPEMCEDIKLCISAGRHPVVDGLMGEHDQYVPNHTELQGDGERVMIITGPNMGGKSSYIRQVALITIMAQVGSYVPADTAQIGLFNAIYTRMGARDEIYSGRSTFMVELQETSEMMRQATDRSLVILDELGRGTSTHDGVAIAQASLNYFISRVKCLTLFVTHYPSLAEFEHIYPKHVKNYHMSFLLQDELDGMDNCASEDVITFLYQLVSGTAARSYGLNVARLAEIPSDIVKVASQKSKELEASVTKQRSNVTEFQHWFKTNCLKNVREELQE